MYSSLIGFFGVPPLLQLLLFFREVMHGANIPTAFWNSHQKLLLGVIGTSICSHASFVSFIATLTCLTMR